MPTGYDVECCSPRRGHDKPAEQKLEEVPRGRPAARYPPLLVKRHDGAFDVGPPDITCSAVHSSNSSRWAARASGIPVMPGWEPAVYVCNAGSSVHFGSTLGLPPGLPGGITGVVP